MNKQDRKKKHQGQQQKQGFFSRFKKQKVYQPRTISLQAEGKKKEFPLCRQRGINIVNVDKEKKKYPANVIINQKYNIFTFIPIVLFEQVMKRERENTHS
jgi:phospholipid-translocating ATPase